MNFLLTLPMRFFFEIKKIVFEINYINWKYKLFEKNHFFLSSISIKMITLMFTLEMQGLVVFMC